MWSWNNYFALSIRVASAVTNNFTKMVPIRLRFQSTEIKSNTILMLPEKIDIFYVLVLQIKIMFESD